MIVALGTLPEGARFKNDWGEYEVVRQGQMGTYIRKLGTRTRTMEVRKKGMDEKQTVEFKQQYETEVISSATEVTPL